MMEACPMPYCLTPPPTSVRDCGAWIRKQETHILVKGACLLLSSCLRAKRNDDLLTVILVRDGELLAAFSATAGQDATAILAGHSLAEAVLVDATAVVWLECSFHCCLSFIVYYHHKAPRERRTHSRYGLQNYRFFLN